jgi:hypothetical protein
VEVNIHASLTSALDRSEQWASRSRRLTYGTILLEDMVGPEAGKDMAMESTRLESNSSPSVSIQ